MIQIFCTSIEATLKPFEQLNLNDSFAVNIFVVDCTLFYGHLTSLEKFLHKTEIEPIKRFKNLNNQRNKLVGRSVRKWIISRYLQIAPADILFETDEFGKPFCRIASIKNIFFNSADSGKYMVFICANKPVGIDIELIDGTFRYDEIVAAYFTELEKKILTKDPQNNSLFYTFWTRKEAVLKAIGKGLQEDLGSIEVVDGVNQNTNDCCTIINRFIVSSFVIAQNYFISFALPVSKNKIAFYSILPEDMI